MPTRQPQQTTNASSTGLTAQSDRTIGSNGSSAQIRETKGLALELKGMLKRKDPWDRTVHIQRETLRKSYLRLIFSPSPSSSSSSTTTTSTSHPARILDLLNLLWLDTSHAPIQAYRSRLTDLDKALAFAPSAHKSKNRPSVRNSVEVTSADPATNAPPPVGPVARRKLVHTFRQFLNQEEEIWRTICGRLAGCLYEEEAEGLRPLGIIASAFSASFPPEEFDGGQVGKEPAPTLGEAAFKARRSAILPLAHKALICFGDLARYSELYSEDKEKSTNRAGSGRGKGRGGKQAGGGGGQEKKVKSFSKAAECYTQARLLMPDNGNPSNQLAVLSQYASDPLSSVHHYYRALAVRQPFATARANLQITFRKTVQKWFAPGGENEHTGEGDEAQRCRSAFVVLMGIAFTREHLADFTILSTHTTALFEIVLRNRLYTSDILLKMVVTALSALWDARMSRSSISSNGSSLAPTASSAQLSTSASSSTEPHLLLHILSMYTTLLRVSSEETNELFTANSSTTSTSTSTPNDGSTPMVPVAQNISAVLRRALPSLRILHTWLTYQLEYLSRVEARVEASERRRAARQQCRIRTRDRQQRTSDGLMGENEGSGEVEMQDAQGSLETDTSGGGGGGSGGSDPTAAAASAAQEKERIGPDELREKMGGMWEAMADFGNSMLVAFPRGMLPTQRLAGEGRSGSGREEEEGVWLEEDVELLGFAPLRRGGGGKGGQGEEGVRGIRRVGRDVHPNEEQLMRVREGQERVERLAESELSRFIFSQGAYVFLPRGAPQPASQPSDLSLPGAVTNEKQTGRDVDMLGEDDDDPNGYEPTEDDPVDLAMRVGAADKVEMDGLSDSEDDYDSDDDEDERIVFEGNRSGSGVNSPAQAQLPPPANHSRLSSSHYSPAASPTRAPLTAGDLRQQLLSSLNGSPRPPNLSPSTSSSGFAFASPACPLAQASAPHSRQSSGPTALPPLPALPGPSSIWGGSPIFGPTSSAPPAPPLFQHASSNSIGSFPSYHHPPTSAQHSHAHGPPVTPRSFEAIPNVVHGSPSSHAIASPSTTSAAWNTTPLPPPVSTVPYGFSAVPPLHPQQQQQQYPSAQALPSVTSAPNPPSSSASTQGFFGPASTYQPGPPPQPQGGLLRTSSSSSSTTTPSISYFTPPSGRTLPPPPGLSTAFAGVGVGVGIGLGGTASSPFAALSSPGLGGVGGLGGAGWPVMPGLPGTPNLHQHQHQPQQRGNGFG
ncbi:hypothetical protein JCM11641_002852 [Rhodosporidiobolus odoratus]